MFLDSTLPRKASLLILFCAFFMLSSLPAFSDNANEIKLVAATFKTLAKSYVAAADIRKLKSSNIQRIKIMNDAHYQKRYKDIYAVLSQMPAAVKSEFHISPALSKNQAIDLISSLDKGKIFRIIDAVPNHVIWNEFNEFMAKGSDQNKKFSLLDKINQAWAMLVERINMSFLRKT